MGDQPLQRTRKVSMREEALGKWLSTPWWVIVLENRPPTLHAPVSEKMSQSNKRNNFNL